MHEKTTSTSQDFIKPRRVLWPFGVVAAGSNNNNNNSESMARRISASPVAIDATPGPKPPLPDPQPGREPPVEPDRREDDPSDPSEPDGSGDTLGGGPRRA